MVIFCLVTVQNNHLPDQLLPSINYYYYFFIEIEDGLHRLGVLIINSTNTLKHLRMRCSKLKNKIRCCQENVSEKSLLISQLEEAIKHLGI